MCKYICQDKKEIVILPSFYPALSNAVRGEFLDLTPPIKLVSMFSSQATKLMHGKRVRAKPYLRKAINTYVSSLPAEAMINNITIITNVLNFSFCHFKCVKNLK